MRSITAKSEGIVPRKKAAEEMKQALLVQAGIIITQLDDERASVTFNKALKIEPQYTINDASVATILRQYRSLTGLELVMEPGINEIPHKVSVVTRAPTSKRETARLFEEALLKQAAVVVTRMDENRASVTYNDKLADHLYPGPE